MAGPAPLVWCAHPRLRCGELFSWWLHRAAWANGVSNHTFVTHLIGGQAIWPRDVDRSITDAAIEACAVSLGVTADRLTRGTLRRYEGTLFPKLTLNGWLPWVTPVGVFHRTQRHHGQAYCSSCLKENRPILLAGRTAMEIACARHRLPLWDGCPHCDAPVTFSRITLGKPGRYSCPACGHNLANAPARPLSNRALAFQRRCHKALRAGTARVGSECVTVTGFFIGARSLLRGLYGRGRLSGLTDATRAKRLRWPSPEPPPDLPFEHWRITHRTRALVALESYFTTWPDHFIADALWAHVYRCRFDSRRRLSEPAWLAKVMDTVEARRGLS